MNLGAMTTIRFIRERLRRIKQFCIFLCTLFVEWLGAKVGLKIARPGYILLLWDGDGAYKLASLENRNLPLPVAHSESVIHFIETEDVILGIRFLRARFAAEQPDSEWFWLTDEAVQQIRRIEKLVFGEGAQL